MKISASIYSNKKKSLKEIVHELDLCNIDMFHIDFNDKNIDLKKIEEDISTIRKISKKPVDLHIISNKPNQYSNFILENKIEYVTYQLETIQEQVIFPTTKYTKFGVALTSTSSINNFKNYSKYCDFILLMTTTPGESGGVFNNINFKKIRDFKKKFPSKEIHVDGGVNNEIAFILRIHGVQSVVSGSYLVNNNIQKSIMQLRSSVSNSTIKVKEFMLSKDESPIIEESNKVKKVLSTIEEYGFGFTMIENNKKEFAGIISMADIRKSLITKLENFQFLNASDLSNKNAIIISENDDINYMIKIIQKHNFLISFMPVINNKNKISGCVTFFNLIKSES